jgi:hypothetical protein
VQSTNVVLALLEEEQFVTDAFLDEDAAGVLLDDGFLVLFHRLERDVFMSSREFVTNLENGIFHLLRLTGFDLVGGFLADVVEFGFVVCDAFF